MEELKNVVIKGGREDILQLPDINKAITAFKKGICENLNIKEVKKCKIDGYEFEISPAFMRMYYVKCNTKINGIKNITFAFNKKQAVGDLIFSLETGKVREVKENIITLASIKFN